jgi:hypothetical protein
MLQNNIMERRHFISNSSKALFLASAGSGLAGSCSWGAKVKPGKTAAGPMKHPGYPMAITMWDFSWLERRWSGAGYEDWDLALDELAERGYNCIRIDAFPHLIAADPNREWWLDPHWDNMVWGSPALNRVRVQPELNQFIEKCAERNIRVALSTWWREDKERHAEKIKTPADLADVWIKTLDSIAEDGLLEWIEFVDFNNEFPIKVWTPYLEDGFVRNSPEGKKWMSESIEIVRKKYPGLDYTFSFTTEYESWETEDVSYLDLLELHIWMVQVTDFYPRTGYQYTPWGNESFNKLQLNGEKEYRANEQYYKDKLAEHIEARAAWSRASGLAIGTTECWGIIDYKDYPLFDWGWVLEICEFGTIEAAKKGRWKYIGTSNFCGPQFAGMWREIEWHKRLTDQIKQSPLDADLLS